MQVFSSILDPKVTELLTSGAVGVIPTDTVYGLVCLATSQPAVERLYAMKQRENKPGTLIAGQLQQLIDLGLKARYLRAVEHYWPNPLSVIIPCTDLAYLHQGKVSLAVRIPADETVRSLLLQTGVLLTSSANQPGQPVATTVAEAQSYFANDVDFYVDGGAITDHVPSTVIRIVDDAIEILREGAVKIDENGRISQ
ncbi:MAG TPA: L-threonylcarbamoyladenylate synthase [Candidatus Saccharimonadales bacterium]|nr:L-threonylcarbamoyladenylate synthase [Candidatus Saccharimonadales bacterium]